MKTTFKDESLHSKFTTMLQYVINFRKTIMKQINDIKVGYGCSHV